MFYPLGRMRTLDSCLQWLFRAKQHVLRNMTQTLFPVVLSFFLCMWLTDLRGLRGCEVTFISVWRSYFNLTKGKKRSWFVEFCCVFLKCNISCFIYISHSNITIFPLNTLSQVVLRTMLQLFKDCVYEKPSRPKIHSSLAHMSRFFISWHPSIFSGWHTPWFPAAG